MQAIPRLEELRKEVGQVDRDLAELQAKKADLDEALLKVNEAKDQNLIERFRAGEPVRLAEVEAKTKALDSELAVVEATIQALMKHKEILMPELQELEVRQKEGEGWHRYALAHVCARILGGDLAKRIREAYKNAPTRRVRLSSGYERIEKHVNGLVDVGSWKHRELDVEALKALRALDPSRFPRPEQVDLDITARPSSATPPSKIHDKASFDAIWPEFLAVRDRFLTEFGIDIGPTDEQIQAKLASCR